MVEMLVRRKEEFPGVLFLSFRIPHSDVAAHPRALDAWLARRRRGEAEVAGTFAWLGRAP